MRVVYLGIIYSISNESCLSRYYIFDIIIRYQRVVYLGIIYSISNESCLSRYYIFDIK